MNEKQRAYANQSIEVLSQTFDLSPEIKEIYKGGDIPLSCVVQYVGGVLNSLKNVPTYERIVRKFEEKFDVHVYYCIPSSIFVTMLYVGKDENEWEYLKPCLGKRVMYAAVYNCTYDFYDFGDVVLGVKNGVLTRIG